MNVKALGREIVERGLAEIDRQLARRRCNGGDFSVTDAALFYVEFWADKTGIALPDHCLGHYRALLQRPAVRQVLMEEGYHASLVNHPLVGEPRHATA